MSLMHVNERYSMSKASLVSQKKGTNTMRIFTNATARDAAISRPVAGMVIYNSELASHQIYDPRGFWRTTNRDVLADLGKTVYDDGKVDGFTGAPAIVEQVPGGPSGTSAVRPAWQMAYGPGRVPAVKSGDGSLYLYDESAGLYRRIKYLEVGTSHRIWLCNDGETIYWLQKNNALNKQQMYRSRIKADDSGIDPATPELVFNCSTDGNTLQHQNLRQYGDTMIFVEYALNGLIEHNVKIWRGTPWGAWDEVYNLQYGHFHSVVHHAATGKWLAFTGDGAYSSVLASDDDGRTWAALGDYFAPGFSHCIACGVEDVGDLTRILLGGDSQIGLSWLDVVAGKITPVMNTRRDDPLGIGLVFDNQLEHVENYYFGIRQFGDLTLIANTPYETRANHHGMVWATRDFVSFMPLYLVPEAQESAMPTAVDRDGKVHCQAMGTSSSDPKDTCITVPSTSRFTRRRLWNKTVNLLTPQQAELATSELPAMWDLTGKVGIQYGSGPDAQNTMLISSAGTGSTTLTGSCPTGLTTTNGVTYYARLKVKADGPINRHWWKWYINGAEVQRPHEIRHGGWDELILFPYTATADGHAIALWYDIRAAATAEDPITVEVTDCIITTVQPSLYVPPGSPESGTLETVTRSAPADGWTHIYAIQPIVQSKHLVNPVTIRKYVKDANNYATLTFNPTTKKFRLTPTVGGVAGTALEIAIEFFFRATTLYLAVRCRNDGGNEKWQLSLSNAHAWVHATEAVHAIGALGTNIAIVYDGTDGNHLTHDVLLDRFVSKVTDAQLVASEWHY